MNLCINIDHVATLREARGGVEPDPVIAATLCEKAGVQGITFHLREDRRHIKERDVQLLKELISTKTNMEMANTKEMVKLAKKFKPDQVTLVPEKRQELTTEGGLNVAGNKDGVRKTIEELEENGIKVSLFIDPIKKQIDASKESGVRCIELHTGKYSNAEKEDRIIAELDRIRESAAYLNKLGIQVYAGHGLNYNNVLKIKNIENIEELNIGHSIISRAVFVGIIDAVKEMLVILKQDINLLKTC